MDEQASLIIRKRHPSEEDLAAQIALLSQKFSLDAYNLRMSLAGDGLAFIMRGEPERLREAGRELGGLGYEWCVTDSKPAAAGALDVKHFRAETDRIVFEGRFGSRTINRGAHVLAVLAGLGVDPAAKLMRKFAYHGGRPAPLTTEEKLASALTHTCVLDLYLLSDPPVAAPDAAEPLRLRVGRFDPASLGKDATSSTSQNMKLVLDLVWSIAGRFDLETDFGLFQLPGCQFHNDGNGSDEELNLASVSAYGWYLLHFYRQGGASTSAGVVSQGAFPHRQKPVDDIPAGDGLPPPPFVDKSNPLLDFFFRCETLSAVFFVLYIFAAPILSALGSPAGRFIRYWAFEKGMFFFLLAPALLFGSIHFLRLKRWIDDTPTSRARSAAMGMVEMQGRCARAYNLVAPVTQVPCVHYILRRYEKGRDRRNPELYSLVGTTTSGPVPFTLCDETGRVTVDPAGASITGTRSRTVEGAGVPWGIPTLLGAMGDDVKFEEEIIPEGALVYVLGFAVPGGAPARPLGYRIAQKLRMLKSDKARMKKYDLNADGEIDEREWAVARADAEQEVLKEELATKAAAPETATVTVRKPPYSGLPFIIAESLEKSLTTKYLLAGWLFGAGAAGAAAAGLWKFFL